MTATHNHEFPKPMRRGYMQDLKRNVIKNNLLLTPKLLPSQLRAPSRDGNRVKSTTPTPIKILTPEPPRLIKREIYQKTFIFKEKPKKLNINHLSRPMSSKSSNAPKSETDLQSASTDTINIIDDLDNTKLIIPPSPSVFSRPVSRNKVSIADSNGTSSPVKLFRSPEIPNEPNTIRARRGIMRSAPFKYTAIESVDELTNLQIKSPAPSTIRRTKSASSRQGFSLDLLCMKPKQPRFTANLSVDAQFAMLKTYEDLLREELCQLYPNLDVARTPSFLFKSATANKDDLQLLTERSEYVGETNRAQSEFSVTTAFRNKIKISHFIETSMKILDIIREYRKENKDKINLVDDYDAEDLQNPLNIFNEWVNMWNNEFLNTKSSE